MPERQVRASTFAHVHELVAVEWDENFEHPLFSATKVLYVLLQEHRSAGLCSKTSSYLIKESRRPCKSFARKQVKFVR